MYGKRLAGEADVDGRRRARWGVRPVLREGVEYVLVGEDVCSSGAMPTIVVGER